MTEVLPMPNDPPFSHAPLHRSTSTTSFLERSSNYAAPRKNSFSYSDLHSGSLSSSQTSSFRSTPASSISLDTHFDDDEDDSDEDGGFVFPSYSRGIPKSKPAEMNHDTPPSSPVASHRTPALPTEVDPVASAASTPDLLLHSEDDTAVRSEPSHHVDYLSHEWKEEDIWSSWRHIVEHRSIYGERSRLENASWRTWAKSQFKLSTVSPETLNWLKDCDVTWLYGPLQPAANRSYSQNASEPVSRLSKTNSFLHKKPILKKRSMSEVMLQKSISASSLVKQAAAAVQAQQTGQLPQRRRNRPIIGRAISDYGSSIPSAAWSRDTHDWLSSKSTSEAHTPETGERKHIRFNENVEQCIAITNKDDDADDVDQWAAHDSDDDSDDGVVMMKTSSKKRPLPRSSSKSNISRSESKTILKLPPTTLRRSDSPDVTNQPQHQPSHSLGLWRTGHLSPSPSQETLRPSRPSANFLLSEDDDDEDADDEDPWEPASSLSVKRPTTPTQQNPHPEASPPTLAPPAVDGTPGSSDPSGLRRTASGMFMPFEDEDEEPQPPGLIGRVVDTVNTARDIIHVVWNVGWRS